MRRRSCGAAAAVLLWAALPAGMGVHMLLRRAGTPCCSIGLARGPGSTWVLAETRARRAGKSPWAGRGGDRHRQWLPSCSGSQLATCRSIVLLLFLQEQNLATAIYLFGLGTLLTGLGLKHMRLRSHHDLAGALVTSLLLGRPWWSTTSPTCLPLSVSIYTNDRH